MNYVTVTSIDAMSQKVQANGGVVVLPKQEIGMGMGWIAAFKDPENNIIGLHEAAPAPKAKAPARKPAKKSAGKAKTHEAQVAVAVHDPRRSAREQVAVHARER